MPSSLPDHRVARCARGPAIAGLALIGLLTMISLAAPTEARAQDSTGTLVVRVTRASDSLPLAGVFVRSGRLAGTTDPSGVARIELPAALQSITVSRAGFLARTFEMTIVAHAAQSVDLTLEPEPDAGNGASLEVARTGLPAPREPTPIRIADLRDLTDQTQAHPADLAGLLGRIPGARMQPLSGPLDAARLRMQGVPGSYTGVLIDGLPLVGQSPGGFGLMDQTPIDLERVEVVSGAGAALYGPNAPAAVINLVPRAPDHDAARLTINQSSEKGGDLTFWGARRKSPTVGATLAADFHQQRQVDADDDTWGEFPRTIRLAVRPRVYVDRPSGDGLVGTLGAMSESRTGGFLLSNTDTDLYREQRQTQRIDGGIRAWRNGGDRTGFGARLAAVYEYDSHTFDDIRERGRKTLVFGEVTYHRGIGRTELLVGAAYQRDALRGKDFPAFDYTYSVPSFFGQLHVESARPVSGTLSVRCDFHNVFGTFCVPRLALLATGRRVVARFTAAGGYRAPTSLEEVETVGLHALAPRTFNAERIQTASLDLSWQRGPLELGGGLGFTRITRPLQLVPRPVDPDVHLWLQNATQPTRIGTAQLTGAYRAPPFTVTAFYQFARGTEADTSGVARRLVPLVPRHSLGATLRWESPASGTRVTIEGAYTGEQAVWDNPRRTRTPGYSLLHLLVTQRTGRARLYVSGENVFDVRLADYEPVFLSNPEIGGRLTATPWVPLRGRVISLGALVDW